MVRSILVTSGKGGVGKTTVCCNLGVCLARLGHRVLIADLDFGLSCADVLLGVESLPGYDLADAALGKCRSRQALVRHPRYPTLSVTGSSRTPGEYLTPQAISLVLTTLSTAFDFILIDCPAGIDEGFRRAAACADEALIVTVPTLGAMRDAGRVAGLLADLRYRAVRLVVNRLGDGGKKGLTAAEISAALHLPVCAEICEDEHLREGISERSRAMRRLAQAVLEGEDEGKPRGIFATWGRKT